MKKPSARRVVVFVGVLALLTGLSIGHGHLAAQQKPTRLVVINNTRTVAELFALTRQGEQSRGRINPGSSLPVYNVNNGDRFRAVWKGGSKPCDVTLSFDRDYGGWQYVCSLQ